jgi:glutamate synthase (NADPH/NADH) small chain
MTEKQEISAELKERLKAEYDKEWRKELRKSLPIKERMKIPRQKMPEREPEERNRDFGEVNRGLDTEAAVLEARRCWDCANPGCVAGCPVSIDIPSFIKLIEKRDLAASMQPGDRTVQPIGDDPPIAGRQAHGFGGRMTKNGGITG